MKALIVAGGQAPSRSLLQEAVTWGPEVIIAADSGAQALLDQGHDFQLVVGDFDSLSPAGQAKLKDREVQKLPVAKNFTDTEAAYHEAVKRGASQILLLGATGSRLDHVLANLSILLIAKGDGVGLRIRDDHNEIYLMTESGKIPYAKDWHLSFFPLGGPVENFSIIGAKYPLKDYQLTMAATRTVSNEFVQGDVEVTFTSGNLLVILSRD